MWDSVKNLETKTKILALIFTVLVIGGTMTMAFAAPDESTIAPKAGESAQAARRLIAQKRLFLARWLLTKGEQTTLEGTIVTHVPGVTVVETAGSSINVLTPANWLLDGESTKVVDLMAQWKGQTTTMECLRVEYNGKVKTTIYAVYKITVGDSSAEAILPVNISSASS
jgi:hypothetical protein